ncbi:hypothetical protein [Pseudomonas helleri]|nr:hypothetical protein [Pseudomonas helleri]
MDKIVPDPPLDAFHTSAHRGTLLFATHPGIPARDALEHVSLLLKGA